MTGRNSAMWMLTLALALFLVPLQWIAAAVVAAAFHEFCHYVVLRLCGGKANGVLIGLTGVKMRIAGLSNEQELLCALAGPVGSFFLLFLARWLPRTAICAGVQGIYNLLPVYPLDGGRILRCCAELCLPPHTAASVCEWMQWFCLMGILFLGIYGCFAMRLGVAPLLGAIYLVGRTFRGKIPCKPWGNSVQ